MVDEDNNMVFVNQYLDAFDPLKNFDSKSKGTMDIDVMGQRTTGMGVKEVKGLSNPIWITLNIKGGPDVKCAYFDKVLNKIVNLEGETTDPNKNIRCKVNHLSTFTSTTSVDSSGASSGGSESNALIIAFNLFVILISIL